MRTTAKVVMSASIVATMRTTEDEEEDSYFSWSASLSNPPLMPWRLSISISLMISWCSTTSNLRFIFLDAIASPSTYPCQWVSGSVIDSFKLEIAIASPSFASLFWQKLSDSLEPFPSSRLLSSAPLAPIGGITGRAWRTFSSFSTSYLGQCLKCNAMWIENNWMVYIMEKSRNQLKPAKFGPACVLWGEAVPAWLYFLSFENPLSIRL